MKGRKNGGVLVLVVSIFSIVAAFGGTVGLIAATSGNGTVQPTPTATSVPAFLSEPSFYLDTDGDGMNDWFESNIAGTDPDVYNQRFVIYAGVASSNGNRLCDTATNSCVIVPDADDKVAADLREFFVEKESIPEDNVNLMIWTEATENNFVAAVDEVSAKSDSESLVYVFLHSHGSDNSIPTMWFYKENGLEFGSEWGEEVSYSEVGALLNGINCKQMFVCVFSCAYEDAIEPLSQGSVSPRVVAYDGPAQVLQSLGYQGMAPHDGNQDGFVSVAEALSPPENIVGTAPHHASHSDPFNIANSFYFGDYTYFDQE